MEFSEVIAMRRSVRHFNSKLDVPDEEIRGLLEIAVAAPTAGNIQPWRFTVVRSLEARERLYAIQDTSAAVENILLAAVDRGLSSCWIGAFDAEAVRSAIGLSEHIEPVAILPIGYSAESAGRPARRPLSEVATWI
jgi:nitroreductase